MSRVLTAALPFLVFSHTLWASFNVGDHPARRLERSDPCPFVITPEKKASPQKVASLGSAVYSTYFCNGRLYLDQGHSRVNTLDTNSFQVGETSLKEASLSTLQVSPSGVWHAFLDHENNQTVLVVESKAKTLRIPCANCTELSWGPSTNQETLAVSGTYDQKEKIAFFSPNEMKSDSPTLNFHSSKHKAFQLTPKFYWSPDGNYVFLRDEGNANNANNWVWAGFRNYSRRDYPAPWSLWDVRKQEEIELRIQYLNLIWWRPSEIAAIFAPNQPATLRFASGGSLYSVDLAGNNVYYPEPIWSKDVSLALGEQFYYRPVGKNQYELFPVFDPTRSTRIEFAHSIQSITTVGSHTLVVGTPGGSRLRIIDSSGTAVFQSNELENAQVKWLSPKGTYICFGDGRIFLTKDLISGSYKPIGQYHEEVVPNWNEDETLGFVYDSWKLRVYYFDAQNKQAARVLNDELADRTLEHYITALPNYRLIRVLRNGEVYFYNKIQSTLSFGANLPKGS